MLSLRSLWVNQNHTLVSDGICVCVLMHAILAHHLMNFTTIYNVFFVSIHAISTCIISNGFYNPAISITDNVSMLFGGSDAPLALGCLYSLGSINMENNGKVQAGVTDALESFGVAENRIYINFFDVPRANVGWNRATFAG